VLKLHFCGVSIEWIVPSRRPSQKVKVLKQIWLLRSLENWGG